MKANKTLTFSEHLEWTSKGSNVVVFPALGVVFNFELEEGQIGDSHLKPCFGIPPHRVEAIVLDVLSLKLIVIMVIIWMSTDANLHVRVNHISIQLTIRSENRLKQVVILT